MRYVRDQKTRPIDTELNTWVNCGQIELLMCLGAQRLVEWLKGDRSIKSVLIFVIEDQFFILVNQVAL